MRTAIFPAFIAPVLSGEVQAHDCAKLSKMIFSTIRRVWRRRARVHVHACKGTARRGQRGKMGHR
jgi:hypothetical protein